MCPSFDNSAIKDSHNPILQTLKESCQYLKCTLRYQCQCWPYLALTFRPVPVLALIIASALELVDVLARGITVVFSPVGTITVVFFQLIADSVSHLPHIIDRLVRVFASVCVVSAAIRGRCSEEKNKQKLHDGVMIWINNVVSVEWQRR